MFEFLKLKGPHPNFDDLEELGAEFTQHLVQIQGQIAGIELLLSSVAGLLKKRDRDALIAAYKSMLSERIEMKPQWLNESHYPTFNDMLSRSVMNFVKSVEGPPAGS